MNHLWLPKDVSSFGYRIDGVIFLIFAVVGVWFLLAEGILLYFAIRYRRSVHPKATYSTGKTRKAMAWIMIPVLLVLVCDFAFDAKGAPGWEEIKIEIPPHDVLVRIEAQQFAWNFRDAGPDGKLDTADDVVINGQLHVPVNKVVRFELQSRDVIHSFFMPNLRLKQDAVPGRNIAGWFKATATGEYPIMCAEICGTGHGIMAATLVVDSEAEYQNYLTK